MPLTTGTCATCAAEKVKLRSNPFSNTEECEDCRKSGPKAIIVITDIKKEFKLKDTDIDGLQMVKEDKPAFVGGPPYRWYLLKEVEKRAGEVEKIRKESAEKEKKAAAKEEEKLAKAAARAKTASDREVEKVQKAEDKKRKREAKDATDSGTAKRTPKAKAVATPRSTPRRAAANKKSIVDNEHSDED